MIPFDVVVCGRDKDGSGNVDREEFRSAILGLGTVSASAEELDALWDEFDANNNGEVSVKELKVQFDRMKMANNAAKRRASVIAGRERRGSISAASADALDGNARDADADAAGPPPPPLPPATSKTRPSHDSNTSGPEEEEQQQEVTLDDMDKAAEKLKKALERLCEASEPLEEVCFELRDAVDDQLRLANENRVRAKQSEKKAAAAASAAEKAAEYAAADEEMAANSEDGLRNARAKAETARSEFSRLKAAAEEAQKAALKAQERLEAMRKEAGVTTSKNSHAPSLADNAAKDAADAAAVAEAEALTATSNEDLSSQRAATFRKAATKSAEESAAAKAEAEAAKEKSIEDAGIASVDIFRIALQDAIAVDSDALHKRIETWALGGLRQTGGAGLASYAHGQPLAVFEPKKELWLDVAVASPPSTVNEPGEHALMLADGSKELTVSLHPWNHAPLLLPSLRFEAVRTKHVRSMRTGHATFSDAMTGNALDVLKQCVPVAIAPVTTPLYSHDSIGDVHDVASLAAWLVKTHHARCKDGAAQTRGCVLITAGPASGKTCLMSQVVTHVLQNEKVHLVPICVKVQMLQHYLSSAEHAPSFATAWNWVDALLRTEHGPTSDVYRMLRQAMMARRALLLIDGLDEGGEQRTQIEKHITDVLAPQGHVVVLTSRPAGVREELFVSHFFHMRLAPLTDVQQQAVMEQRCGHGPFAEALPRYVSEKVPIDPETGQRVTGNPLMLSVVIGIFEEYERTAIEKRQSTLIMPETSIAIYEHAASAILEREGIMLAKRVSAAGNTRNSSVKVGVLAATYQVKLLRATFFEAHAAHRRVIQETQLEEAALGLLEPDQLAQIRAEMPEYDGRVEKGHYVEILLGRNVGRRGVVSGRPFRVTFRDGTTSEPLREADFRSSGLDEEEGREFEQMQKAGRVSAVRAACEVLSVEMRAALKQVKERVLQDKLPLLSLLQAEPTFHFEASHLSFQEYYAAKALCSGRALPSDVAAPWRWGAWWHNVLILGAELGDAFGKGLLEAAGCDAAHLELKGKVGGDRPTSLLAVSNLMRATESINLSSCAIGPVEALRIAEGLRKSGTLTALNLSSNRVAGVWFEAGEFKGDFSREAIDALAHAVKTSPTLTSLDLSQCSLGISYVAGERVMSMGGLHALADAVRHAPALKRLALAYNSIGREGGAVVGDAFGANANLTALDISGNLIGSKGGKAVAAALEANPNFAIVDLRYNSLDGPTRACLSSASKVRAGLRVEF